MKTKLLGPQSTEGTERRLCFTMGADPLDSSKLNFLSFSGSPKSLCQPASNLTAKRIKAVEPCSNIKPIKNTERKSMCSKQASNDSSAAAEGA